MDPVLTEWYISLESWVLEDGNYTDFAVGQRRQFALELGHPPSARLEACDPSERAVRPADRHGRYVVRGELLRDSPRPRAHGFVLDFGLLAHSRWIELDDLETPSVGTWLAGEITLTVDPWLDGLGTPEGTPPLVYTWEVLGIERDISPTIQVEHGDPLYSCPDEGPHLVRDPTRELHESVERTRMWDDVGLYRLRCSLLAAEPTASMARSGARSPYGPL